MNKDNKPVMSKEEHDKHFNDFLNNYTKGGDMIVRVMPPAKVECGYCAGLGYNDDLRDRDYNDSETCQHCHGTGEVYNYLTPEQFRAWMRQNGHPMWTPPGRIAVWQWTPQEFDINGVCTLLTWEASYLDAPGSTIKIIARPDQPAPPDEWRPE